MPLYHLKCNKDCIIERLPRMGLLNSLGLRQGITVSMVSKQPFSGPVVIKAGNRNIALARAVAEQIEVKEV